VPSRSPASSPWQPAPIRKGWEPPAASLVTSGHHWLPCVTCWRRRFLLVSGRARARGRAPGTRPHPRGRAWLLCGPCARRKEDVVWRAGWGRLCPKVAVGSAGPGAAREGCTGAAARPSARRPKGQCPAPPCLPTPPGPGRRATDPRARGSQKPESEARKEVGNPPPVGYTRHMTPSLFLSSV
jgi:hypothetical protein